MNVLSNICRVLPWAIALYRKYGFEDEGVMRDYGFRAGRYADVLMMSRMRYQ